MISRRGSTVVKNRKKRGFKEVLSKCLDCGNRFNIDDKECDECGSKNIRQGGWFKVNKAKKQLTEELVNE
jgi:rRNA maturation endonuclease Nob1